MVVVEAEDYRMHRGPSMIKLHSDDHLELNSHWSSLDSY